MLAAETVGNAVDAVALQSESMKCHDKIHFHLRSGGPTTAAGIR